MFESTHKHTDYLYAQYKNGFCISLVSQNISLNSFDVFNGRVHYCDKLQTIELKSIKQKLWVWMCCCKTASTQQYAQCCTHTDRIKSEFVITEPQHQQTCHHSAMTLLCKVGMNRGFASTVNILARLMLGSTRAHGVFSGTNEASWVWKAAHK